MKDSRFKPITHEELVSIVDRQIRNSVGYYDSKLSLERQNVLDYYNGAKPKPVHSGNSKYISLDVFDSVESLKAVLLETFGAGNGIVAFDPQGPDDVQQAKEATEYCDYVIFRQNDGYKIFSDTIQDGLMARVGVSKVYWQEHIEEVEEEFSNLTLDEVDVLLAQPDVKNVDYNFNEDTGLFDGDLIRQVDKSRVHIDVIPPEEFLITPQAVNIDMAPFVGHRTRKTYAELIEEGYDKEKVYKIGASDETELSTNPEVLSRFEGIGAERLNLSGEVQEQSRFIMVYECYMYLDRTGDGRTKLYRIVKAGNVILEDDEVDKKPFIPFVPMPLPHSFYGSNYAAKVIPTQNARTTLVRGILDHTVSTNNPRYQVVKGALTNPKELIENRFGGIVNVTRPDGIAPLPQASLNPFVFQTIQLLDEDKEEATGVSRLSQGLNKDAVSKQNSGAMIESLVSLSQQREKIIARNFANQFVKALYLEVYRLVCAHEKGAKVVNVAGSFKRIDPSSWDDRTDVIVEMKLGYGEKDQEVQKYIGIHQFLSQDPGFAPMYGMDKKFNMAKEILDKSGLKNVVEFLTPPDQVQPAQPDPMQMKMVELEERKVAANEKIAQNQSDKIQLSMEMERMRLELQKMKQDFDDMIKQREQDRKEFDTTAKAAIAAEEIAAAKALPDESKRGILSPN